MSWYVDPSLPLSLSLTFLSLDSSWQTRVSSAMSNAPVILTLDCDMYCNNPRAPLHALCYFLDPVVSADLAYVQFPQCFHGINENDIYASEIKRLFKINSRGMDGLRGPNYVGTGCFFSRRSLHSTGLPAHRGPSVSESALQKAVEAAACSFELGTKWGSSVTFGACSCDVVSMMQT